MAYPPFPLACVPGNALQSYPKTLQCIARCLQSDPAKHVEKNDMRSAVPFLHCNGQIPVRSPTAEKVTDTVCVFSAVG